jgi:hypothetical protein
MKWSCENVMTIPQFLFMFTNFVNKTSRFILRGNLGTDLFNYMNPKGPSIFFIIITSVQRVLFFTTPLSPMKVYKSSEKMMMVPDSMK